MRGSPYYNHRAHLLHHVRHELGLLPRLDLVRRRITPCRHLRIRTSPEGHREPHVQWLHLELFAPFFRKTEKRLPRYQQRKRLCRTETRPDYGQDHEDHGVVGVVET